MTTKVNNRMIDGAALNVLDYGAVGDGVTDDHSAITECIEAARVISGKVYFPKGTYYCSQTLIFYSAILYEGAGKSTTTLLFADGINGVQINPSPEFSIAYMDIKHMTIRANNNYPSAAGERGIRINLTAACRRLNISDVEIRGFTNGVDGRCPFYLCTFKNMNIEGIVPRDINDLPGYDNDNSYGFASGYNDKVSDARDATTVTLENVFCSAFGIGIHNRYTSAMQLVNCVAERCYYGLLADKGLTATMYQEWNKEACLIRDNLDSPIGSFTPAGVHLTAINNSASWGPVVAASTEVARPSKFLSLSENRGLQQYEDITPVTISESVQYLEFNQLNGEVITGVNALQHRTLGNYEAELSFNQNNNPSAQGTYIFDIQVQEDEEPTFRTVQRGFVRVTPEDDFLGTYQFNYKGTVRGTLSNVRIAVSRVDGEAFGLVSSSVNLVIRPLYS